MTLLDPNGRPYPKGEPLEELQALGVRDLGDRYDVPKEVVDRLRRDQARQIAVSAVPSAPRFLHRDGQGLALSKQSARWPHIGHDMLRDLRDRAPILQPIHIARQYQIRRLAQRWMGKKGQIGWRVVHRSHFEHDATPPADIKPFIARFERMLEEPSITYGVPTLSDALTMLWEDLATINRPAIEVIHSSVDSRRIVQWRPIDGALIWPTLRYVEHWKAQNPTWSTGYDTTRLRDTDMIEIVSHALQRDLFGAEYCLVREGIVEALYPRGQIVVGSLQNRTDIRYVGYPPSTVEQALGLVAAFVNTFDYNASYFTKGMLAEFILGIPAEMHPDDIDAFVDMFRESTQGVGTAWRPPILPLPAGQQFQKIDLKPSNKEMMYEVWMSLLLALTTACYRMDPSTINGRPWAAGASPGLSEGNRTEEIGLAKEEGLQGDMQHLIDHVLNPLARRCHPDLRVVFEYGDNDETKEAAYYEVRTRVDMTRNEARLAQGLGPLGFWLTREHYENGSDEERAKFDQNPYNMPADSSFAQMVKAQSQADLQKKAMEQYGQQPGQPQGGFGEPDDGFGGGEPGGQFPFGQPGAPGAPPGGPPGAPPGAPGAPPAPPGAPAAGPPGMARAAPPGAPRPGPPRPPPRQPPGPSQPSKSASFAKARTTRIYIHDED